MLKKKKGVSEFKKLILATDLELRFCTVNMSLIFFLMA